MLKVYCDTNVFIDYLQERTDPMRPLKDFAFEFFSKGWNCAFHLVVSDYLLTELRRHLSEKQIEIVLNNYRSKGKLILVSTDDEDRKKARSYEHRDDALHAILAAKAGADYLTTRNIKHYDDCGRIIRVVLPEFI